MTTARRPPRPTRTPTSSSSDSPSSTSSSTKSALCYHYRSMREIKRTTCNRDCPDACAILATVEDGRITSLKGDPAHPITQGFLCYRTSHFLETQYSPA